MGSSLELAQFLLTKAVQLDEKGRWTESVNYYQEGITELMKYLREIGTRPEQKQIREKIETYIKRAEILKEKLEVKKKMGNYREQIEIEANSKDHSYEQVFGRFLDDTIQHVNVEDPYICKTIQLYNFLQFCELVVKKCPNIKSINLLTTPANKIKDGNSQMFDKQSRNFKQLQNSLKQHKINFSVSYSTTLHDRKIQLGDSWIIQIGRGLDYFKHIPEFSIGFTDMSLRECNQTTVDIYHMTALIQ